MKQDVLTFSEVERMKYVCNGNLVEFFRDHYKELEMSLSSFYKISERIPMRAATVERARAVIESLEATVPEATDVFMSRRAIMKQVIQLFRDYSENQTVEKFTILKEFLDKNEAAII